jgi:hypothetical protein
LVLSGTAGSWTSLWALQHLGPREGRWGFWRCAIPSVWVAGVLSLVFFCGMFFCELSCVRDRLSSRFQEVLSYTLPGTWCLAWNLFWAWQVARREARLAGEFPAGREKSPGIARPP